MAIIDTPIVSCLIPVFNGEQYLDLALESIARQSFSDFEVVLVNDGSTDGSLAILDRFAASDPRIRVFSKDNGGIVSALNFGLAHCRGKFIARMDCDDIALPGRFALQLKTFADRPDAVAVGGLIQRIDEHGRAIAAPSSPSRVEKTDLLSFPPAVANVQHSAGMFLKSAMDAIGGYRDTFPYAEDYDLYLRLAPFGKFYNPKQLVIYYRVHSNSLSIKNLERQETSAVLAELSAFARRDGLVDLGDSDLPATLEDYVGLFGARFPEKTLRRYIAFRIWRRVSGYRNGDSRARLRAIVRDLVNPRRYVAPADRALSVRIALSLGRGSVFALRHRAKAILQRA